MAVPALVLLSEPPPLMIPSSSNVLPEPTSKFGVAPLVRTTLFGSSVGPATEVAKFGLLETVIVPDPAAPALLKLILPPDRFTPPENVLATASVAVPPLTFKAPGVLAEPFTVSVPAETFTFPVNVFARANVNVPPLPLTLIVLPTNPPAALIVVVPPVPNIFREPRNEFAAENVTLF